MELKDVDVEKYVAEAKGIAQQKGNELVAPMLLNDEKEVAKLKAAEKEKRKDNRRSFLRDLVSAVIGGVLTFMIERILTSFDSSDQS